MTDENDNKVFADVAANDSTSEDQKVEQLKSENDNKMEVSDSTIQSVHKMCQELLEKQKNLEISNSEIVEKLRLAEENYKNLKQDHQEKLDLIQSKLNEIEKTLKPEVPSKMEENDDSTNSERVPTYGKYFVLKHKFKNVSNMKNGEKHASDEEEHFGVSCLICVKRNDGYLSFFLVCLSIQDTERKSDFKIEYELKIASSSSREKKMKFRQVFKNDGTKLGCGLFKFIEWEKLEEDFLVDDCFCAEIAVKLKRMTGSYKENLRSFDKTMEGFSDVVLIVEDEKFYVLKLYLAAHSPYFQALFLGQFNESKKSEIRLNGIDADDFQKYLEILYGEQAIDEITVEGILIVADMFDTPLVIQKCENFLLKESKKNLKKKLQMSIRYNLDALKKQCISEINSIDDIKSVIPANIHDMDSSIMAELFQKFLKLH